MKWKHRFRSGRLSADISPTSKEQQPEKSKNSISPELLVNQQRIENTFANCHDMHLFQWRYGTELKHTAFSIYLSTLIQEKKVNYMKETLQDLVSHEIGPATMVSPEDVMFFFKQHGVSAQSAILLDSFDQAIQNILDGHIVIFFNQWNQALSYNALGLQTRQVTEPINEPVVMGPKMGAVEELNKNIGMIRMGLKTPHLKIETFKSGEKVKREIAFGYLEGTIDLDILAEFKQRIAGIDKAEILETSYLEEWIEDSSYSPFPQVRYTERPDTAIAALLEGKIIVMVDGTPTILICPALFTEFFTVSEDYYNRMIYSTLIRQLRIAAFFMALSLPSIYIAFSTFHSELIPTILLLAVLDTREGIPFPSFVEALIMEFFFELLREAGIRLPRPVGSAVSIVGALVIGQAAIEAKIASPIMVIIVALTGIASFALPQYTMAITLRVLRFPLMILAATLGGFGLMVGLLLILLHLTCLEALGQPYLSPLAPLEPRQLKDVFIRAPRRILLRFPRSRNNR